MRLTIFAIIVLALLAASGCDSGSRNQKDQAVAPPNSAKNVTSDRPRGEDLTKLSDEELARRLAGGSIPQPPGRYQILSTGQKTLKLDTATGETWALENSQWKPLSTAPAKAN
jgi:hypothetical protein